VIGVAPAADEGARKTQQRVNARERMSEACADLFAAAFAEQAPCAEVLAVIGQQAIAVFAEPRASAQHGMRARIRREPTRAHRNGVAIGELLDWDFFDGAATHGLRETRVVDDHTATSINTVMFVAMAFRDQVGTEREFVMRSVKREIRRRMIGCASSVSFAE
jgi:hypothetical protein